MAKKSKEKSLQLGRAVEWPDSPETVSYTHLTLPTNREV